MRTVSTTMPVRALAAAASLKTLVRLAKIDAAIFSSGALVSTPSRVMVSSCKMRESTAFLVMATRLDVWSVLVTQ